MQQACVSEAAVSLTPEQLSFAGESGHAGVTGASLAVQGLRLHSPKSRVPSLVRELDPTGHN